MAWVDSLSVCLQIRTQEFTKTELLGEIFRGIIYPEVTLSFLYIFISFLSLN